MGIPLTDEQLKAADAGHKALPLPILQNPLLLLNPNRGPKLFCTQGGLTRGSLRCLNGVLKLNLGFVLKIEGDVPQATTSRTGRFPSTSFSSQGYGSGISDLNANANCVQVSSLVELPTHETTYNMFDEG